MELSDVKTVVKKDVKKLRKWHFAKN